MGTVLRLKATTDGFGPYKAAIADVLGTRLDFATLVKMYGKFPDEGRYSPREDNAGGCVGLGGSPLDR